MLSLPIMTVLQLDPGHQVEAPGEDGAVIEGRDCCYSNTLRTTAITGVELGFHGDDPIGPVPLERVAGVRYVSSQPPS